MMCIIHHFQVANLALWYLSATNFASSVKTPQICAGCLQFFGTSPSPAVQPHCSKTRVIKAWKSLENFSFWIFFCHVTMEQILKNVEKLMWLQSLQGNPLSSENDIWKGILISRIKLRPQAWRASLAECSRANSGCRQSQNLHRLLRKCREEILASSSFLLSSSPPKKSQGRLALPSPWKRKGWLREQNLGVSPQPGNPCGHSTEIKKAKTENLEAFSEDPSSASNSDFCFFWGVTERERSSLAEERFWCVRQRRSRNMGLFWGLLLIP